MRPSLRVVTRIPLRELWDERGTLQAVRGERIGPSEITEMARRGPFQLVIAAIPAPLQWVPIQERFVVWKKVKTHVLPRAATRVRLEDYDGEYFYIASLWTTADSTPIVLLEMHH